jgi:hypothetical protein
MGDQTAMTKAQAAKLVQRLVPRKDKDGVPVVGRNGQPVMDGVPIAEVEVFAFTDHGDHVVVVTVDGQKFRGKK